MPIYEYVCTACGTKSDILHGINDPSPNFCPACGQEGTMRKQFAPPAIHFRGSGWAKKDRGSSSSGTKASKASDDAGKGGSTATTSSGSSSGDGGSSGSTSTSGASDASGPGA